MMGPSSKPIAMSSAKESRLGLRRGISPPMSPLEVADIDGRQEVDPRMLIQKKMFHRSLLRQAKSARQLSPELRSGSSDPDALQMQVDGGDASAVHYGRLGPVPQDVREEQVRLAALESKISPSVRTRRKSKPSSSRQSTSQYAQVLLVEDVRVSQKLAQMALKRARYHVECADTGEDAVQMYKDNVYNIVLMDVGLPGIDGTEATQQIREFEQQQQRAPALIFGLTGNVQEEDLKQYHQCNMNGCIAKGKLIATSVRNAIRIYQNDPEQFVNLTDSAVLESMDSGSPGGSASPLASGGAQFSKNSKTVPNPNEMRLSPQRKGKKKRIKSKFPNGTVLLVEDVPVSQKIAQRALTRDKFDVDTADTGEEAVDKFGKKAYKIVLMDIHLPGIDGIEATSIIRRAEEEANTETRVIIFGLTGNVGDDNLRVYLEAGMNGCIAKGTQIGKAVQAGMKMLTDDPEQFVNLTKFVPELL